MLVVGDRRVAVPGPLKNQLKHCKSINFTRLVLNNKILYLLNSFVFLCDILKTLFYYLTSTCTRT